MYKCALFGPPRAVVAALTLLTLGPGNRQLTAQTVTSILVESGPNFPRGQTAERLNSGWASRLIMEFGSRRNGIALRIEGNRASFLGDTDTNQFGYVIQYPSLEIDGGRIGVAFSLRAMPKHSLGLHASIGLDRVKKADYQICHPNSGCIVFRERPVGEVVLAGGFSYRVLRFPLQVRIGLDGWNHPASYSSETGARTGVSIAIGVGVWFPR